MLLAAPASANIGTGTAFGLAASLILPLGILALGAWSGADEIMRAKGWKRWPKGSQRTAVAVGFFFSLVGTAIHVLACYGLFALWRGLTWLFWAVQARRAPEQPPPGLAEARPGRLAAAGAAAVAAGIVLGFGGAWQVLWSQPIVLHSMEGQTRSRLAGLRSAPPGGGSPVPGALLRPYHRESSAIARGAAPDDAGGWFQDSAGAFWVNCTHTDSRGTLWSSY